MTTSRTKPQLVFIYGPPAVGKLTVARALADRIGYPVLHNHVTIDAVAEVLPFATKTFWAVVERLRYDLIEAAASERVDLIYTMVYAPSDVPHVERVSAAYENVGGSVMFVRLTASVDELFARVGASSRNAYRKLTDVDTLRQLLDEHDLFAAVPGRESLTIDLQARSASDAAEEIAAELGQIRL